MKRIYFVLIVVSGFKALAQSNTDYQFDPKLDSYITHNAFQFSRISPSQVNEYNGAADVFIPLHTIKFEGLEIPIGIRYNASGIKVNQFATEVGLGWTLEAGGSISKEVNGKYEDNVIQQVDYPYNSYDGGYLATNYMREIPDFYRVTTPGLNGHFLIDNNFQVREIDNLKTCDIGYVRAVHSAENKDKYGVYFNGNKARYLDLETPGAKDTQSISIVKDKYRYSFNQWNHIYRDTKTHDNNYTGPNILLADSHSYNFFNSEYLLTEILDNTTNKKVQIIYADTAGKNPNDLDTNRTWNKIVYQNDDTGGVTQDYFVTTNYTSKTSEWFVKKYVKEIITDEENIVFKYENLREDFTVQDLLFSSPTHEQNIKMPLLRSIEVKNKSMKSIVKYVFNYGYFESGCNDGPLCKRLKLSSIDTYYYDVISPETYTFSYDTSSPLPRIGSFAQDAFGNKTNVSESTVSEAAGPRRPSLFKYSENISGRNYYYYSTINIPNLSPTKLTGQFDLPTATLADTKAWTLSSIKYPTKGEQIFEYEQNQFKWKDNLVFGGGLRIKSITLNSENGSETTSYSYSDGIVAALPFATLRDNIASGPYGTHVQLIPQISVQKLMSSGGYVIYPTVQKILPNGGKIVSNYTSYIDYPENEKMKYYPSSTSTSPVTDVFPMYLFSAEKMGPGLYSNNNFLRGRLKSALYYNANNQVVKRIVNSYEAKDYSFPMYLQSYDYHKARELYFDGSFDPAHSAVDVVPVIRSFNLIGSNVYNVLDGKEILEQNTFAYENGFNLPKKHTRNLSGDIYESTAGYAFEDSNEQILTTPELKQIKTLETKTKNGKIVSQNKTVYAKNASTSNLVLPVLWQEFDLASQSLIDAVTYDYLDSKGNVVQFTAKNGAPTTIIWGYNKALPIAKIEGAAFADLSNDSTITNAINASMTDQLQENNSSEQQLIDALDAVRTNPAFSAYQITTYSYDLLVGVRSITRPGGIKESYTYDPTNRLDKVKDVNNNIISETKYNFKP